MPSQILKRTNVRFIALSLLLRATANISPSLAARALEKLFLYTRKFDAPERERQWLAEATPSTFTSRGRDIAAWSVGEGPTVLLAHGWEGRGSQMGAFVAPLLAAGFRVTTFDAPGHGRSGGRQSSLVEMADAVSDAADAFGPIHAVIAHSAGAAATTVALSRQLAIERAVFIAPPTDLGGFLEKVSRKLGLGDEVVNLTRLRLEEKFEIAWDTLRAETLAPRMTTPLLVIHDEGDREVHIENARKLAATWPSATLVTTRGLGHRRVLRDDDVIDKAVSFVRGEPGAIVGGYASRAVASPASL
jgi:pimeloyl-ACP methyl ester carboxylesterase